LHVIAYYLRHDNYNHRQFYQSAAIRIPPNARQGTWSSSLVPTYQVKNLRRSNVLFLEATVAIKAVSGPHSRSPKVRISHIPMMRLTRHLESNHIIRMYDPNKLNHNVIRNYLMDPFSLFRGWYRLEGCAGHLGGSG